MTKRVKQKNQEGHNVGNDYIGGDKFVNSLIGKIIGNHNVTTIHLSPPSKFKLSKEDEEKFSSFIPEDKIAEFKNLIERIEFLCDLNDYEKAKIFIEEASKIYHNHPILLVFHGLCEYNTLNKTEVILHPKLFTKTVKLFEKAREINESLSQSYGWGYSIAEHFYELLSKYIEAIRKQVRQYFSENRHIGYYKAIAKHLIHLENCYKISNNTFYLKEFILHLSGHKSYAWFNITPSGLTSDLGIGIFEGGANSQIEYLNAEIKKQEPQYILPELYYGDYFDDPKPRRKIKRKNIRSKLLALIPIIGILTGIGFLFFYDNVSVIFVILFIIYSISIWLFSHPFNHQLSIFQKLAKFFEKKL